MNIIDNRNLKMKRFAEIEIGECFIDDDEDVSIKIMDYNTKATSAVCLKDGQQWHPNETNIYEIVTATLGIE